MPDFVSEGARADRGSTVSLRTYELVRIFCVRVSDRGLRSASKMFWAGKSRRNLWIHRMLLLFMGDWRRLIKTEHEPSNRPQREPNKSIMKIIIVGGVAGGASAAARARRLDGAFSLATFNRRRQKFYLSVLCISSGLFSHPHHFHSVSPIPDRKGRDPPPSIRTRCIVRIVRNAIFHWRRDHR